MEAKIFVYILIGVFVAMLIVCLSIASFAGAHVFEKYKYYNNFMSSSFTVASDFCCMVSQRYLNSTVKIGKRGGELTDAYVPNQKIVFLSQNTFDNSSIASLAIAGHELGHAYQDFLDPKLFERHNLYKVLCKVLGLLMYPLFAAGIVLLFASQSVLPSILCVSSAILIFLFALFLKFVTIKIEKDASKKALVFLRELGILDEVELEYARKFLNAALLTYIADFLQAILGWTGLTRKTKIFGG